MSHTWKPNDLETCETYEPLFCDDIDENVNAAIECFMQINRYLWCMVYEALPIVEEEKTIIALL